MTTTPSGDETLAQQSNSTADNSLGSMARLDAIAGLDILDRPTERNFQMLVELANRVLGTPVSLISIVTDERQFFVSSDGLQDPWSVQRETPLSHSFCQHVVTLDAPLVVTDSRQHPLVCENLAIRDLNVGSYLGVPLRSDNKSVLGSFCVIDTSPRQWTDDEISTLTKFAELTVSELNLRVEANRQKSEFEKRLRHAQKMEAIGHFTAGVAHDFNNALGAIQIYCELLKSEIVNQPAPANYVKQVIKTVESAAEVVKQLQSWSRPAQDELDRVVIQDVVEELLPMLQTVLSGNVQLKFKRTECNSFVATSPSLIQQVLTNLSLNADYAMRGTDGQIEIGVEEVSVNEINADEYDLPNGRFVELRVSDNGTGIPPELLDRIADPYFTTKPVGSGTGLGLWTVFGIVSEHGGQVKVFSELGQGATFKIYFPQSQSPSCEIAESTEKASVELERSLSILVVDDNESIAAGMKTQLVLSGYQAECVTDPNDALAIIVADPAKFELVIADQMMPNLKGDKLLSRIKRINPAIQTMICSGNLKMDYAHADIDHYCCKPYMMEDLVAAIEIMFQSQ